jgi:hypothetical protein
VADSEDRLVVLVKVPNHILNALVGPDMLGTPGAGRIDRVVLIRIDFSERFVELEIVPELFGIGLVPSKSWSEVANIWPAFLSGQTTWTIGQRLPSPLVNVDFVFFGELTDEHEDFLAGLSVSRIKTRAGEGRVPLRLAAVRYMAVLIIEGG